ncbi:RcnB family protein [Cobetia marina]|uniref:RcnB family protein n=1 Tax=Cobetia marina TaxID=28258 RepID=UPI0025488AA8|nr:RcnB family protein [Cobetia pacifica]MDI6002418.1 RcnB family protein [Cobetia pacifica]
MRNRTLTVCSMVIALMSASVAQAAPDDRVDRGQGQHQQQRKHSQGNQQGNQQGNHQGNQQGQKHQAKQQHAAQGHGKARAGHHSAGPQHWKRGDHVSRDYYGNKRYWVSDWKAHHLSRPPEGHRWLNVDGRYVLTAVATGVITAIILNQ